MPCESPSWPESRELRLSSLIHPALLRGFFTPSAPVLLRPWTGAPHGPGVYVQAGEPANLAALAGAVEEIERGVVRIAFDPERTIDRLVHESTVLRRRPPYTYLPVKTDWIPCKLREYLLQRSYRLQLSSATSVPRWPIEPCVEEIRSLVWDAARRTGVAAAPVPLWPQGKAYAAMLSHDMDSAEAFRRGYWQAFAELEEAHGLRSSWHFCTEHLSAARPVLEELVRRGHEIGWHGAYHGYRIAYLAPAKLRALLKKNRPLFEEFKIRGFRSPNFLRTPQLYEGLSEAFGYDSSAPDTAPELFSRQGRTGCCTVFPFFHGNLLELPLTLPDDMALRTLYGDSEQDAARVKLAKLDWIKSVGGLAVSLTHPERWISMKPGAFGAYRRLVEQLAKDSSVWVALPREIETWWRARSQVGSG